MINKNSPSAADIFTTIIAVIFTILFVITALITLLVFNIERQAFNPATYEQALVKENFYQQFPALLANVVSKNLGTSAPPFAKQMSAAEWKTLIEALLPPQQLQAMTEDALTQIFAYINGETQTPYLSFAPLKQSLSSSKGLDAALTIIKSQPDCTVAQLANMIASFGQELCNPPAQMLKLVSPFIQAELQAVAAAIPDQVDLIHTNTASQQSAMETLKVLRLVMRLSPLLPLALLFAITLIAVRSFKSWLNWWGWPLLLTGLPGAVIGFGGAPLLRTMMERAISKRLPADIPLEVMDTIRKIVDASLREMLKPAGWEGLFLFVAGVCMVLIAAFLHLREKEKVKTSEATTQIF